MGNIKLKSSIKSLFVISSLIILTSCAEKEVSDLSRESIIPKPVSVSPTGDFFVMKPGMDIYIQGESYELKQAGHQLANRLKGSTGFNIEVKSTNKVPRAGNIFLTVSDNRAELGDEGYELAITGRLLKLSANSVEGIFRGIQTIRQILPAEVEFTAKQTGPWRIASGIIIDYPEYSYRGVMIDVARHFFGVSDMKRIIDFISYYKMNTLHIHLSDDQGWRIEIKSWPDLTTVGGSTQVGGGPGGYYTQEQYADIVKYANACYITVVPEIDMPGHTNAALASYPELNCNGKATDLYTGTEVGFSTLCPGKEITYKFIDDVVRELVVLTPGPYFHIGGDESHVTKKEDYKLFISRAQDIVEANGKKVIGWDDISVASLKINTIAQHWANAENAIRAVSQGAKIIMSPAKNSYLDMKYDSTTKLGQRWAGFIEVDMAYLWNPETLVPGIGKENIIGVEAPLWTETITNIKDLEYMLFPRLPGYAEIGWTPSSERNWIEYRERLGKHGERFKALDINFYQSRFVPWEDFQ